jgi:PAS domain S-box-containing protein
LDERFNKINRLLSNYSLGKFDRRLAISSRMDEVDAFIAGVNMLGEELKSITISRNYFTNIFNSVSDMVFILDKKGIVENINKAVSEQLEYQLRNVRGRAFGELQPVGKNEVFQNILRDLKKDGGPVVKETVVLSASGKRIPVHITAAYLLDEGGNKKAILLSAKDMTLQLKTENLIIRAIIDTQEKERRRLAVDLHDSLGQQLSAIKFFISALGETLGNRQEREILDKSNDALSGILADMRNICFNLMPVTLEEFGLLAAVKELCNKTRYGNKIEFEISHAGGFPKLLKNVEIDIYRVIQEFINNSMKHSNASKITVVFKYDKKNIEIILSDNGQGFDQSGPARRGMGLQNVQSRVKSHKGEIRIRSEKGKGTNYTLTIPLQEE